MKESGEKRGAGRQIVLVAAALLFGTLVCTMCRNQAVDRVRRLTDNVWAGSPAASPPRLDDDEWVDLRPNDVIKTDATGEAELELQDCPGSLYVFTDSTLQVATCRKSQQQSGLAVCASQGTAYFNVQCAGRFTVDTPGSRVTILGTALSVVHLPEQQLSLIILLDGKGQVEPVIDWQTGTLGEPVGLETGQFLWTTPMDEPKEIAGIPQRKAQPVSELPELSNVLPIKAWLETVGTRAADESVLPDIWPTFEAGDGEQELTVWLSSLGGPFDSQDVQAAMLAAIDKEAAIEEAFGEAEPAFRATVGESMIDAYSIAYEPHEAQVGMGHAGYPYGFGAKLLYPAEDDQLGTLAQICAGYLDQVGIDTSVLPVSSADLTVRISTMQEAGENILWLERH